MKVILAQPRGFCAGVVRAIEIVERALAKYGAPIYVRHEIVHNGYVVESLKAKGARFVENLSEVPRGARTIFRPWRRPQRRGRSGRAWPAGHRCDLPLVAKVHNQGERYVGEGRSVVLIGHAGHPEVEGTMGRIPGPVYLVQSEADVEALDLAAATPLAYVTQTTLSVDDTKSVIAALKRRFTDIVGPGNEGYLLRYAKPPNSGAAAEQAGRCHFGCGGQNSSNSNRLREIGAEASVPSYLIADKNELDLDLVRGAQTIGLTAGASAPEILVHEVIEALRSLGPLELSMLPGVEEDIEFRLPSELLDA